MEWKRTNPRSEPEAVDPWAAAKPKPAAKPRAKAKAKPKPKAAKPKAAKPRAKRKPKPKAASRSSRVSYTSQHVGLQVPTPSGVIEFEDGSFTTSDPAVVLTLDGLAVERPDLVIKKAG